jgi:hypothetical protein
MAAAILFAFNPAKVKFFPACPVHSMTGFYCPGCGSLRALHQLVHGNITEALSMNPLMVLSLPLLGFLFVRPSAGYHVWLPWFCFAVLILYGILRNIPLFPFTELAPH